MIRPFISSDGRWTTETVCSAVWSAATRCIAVTMISRAFSFGLLAGRPFDRPGEPDGVLVGLDPDRVEEHALGLIGGHAAHLLECLDLVLRRSSELFAGRLELALTIDELAVLLLEDVGTLVELLVPGEEATLEIAELAPFGSGLVLGLTAEPKLLVLGLEDELLLASPCLGLDPAGLGMCGLDGLRCPDGARKHPGEEPAENAHRGNRHNGRCLHLLLSLPSGVAQGPPSVVMCSLPAPIGYSGRAPRGPTAVGLRSAPGRGRRAPAIRSGPRVVGPSLLRVRRTGRASPADECAWAREHHPVR